MIFFLNDNRFLFFEIFNFFRKFGSNLKNRRSGKSVNTSKIQITTGRHRLTAGVLLWPSRHACGRPWLRASAGSTLRVESASSWPSYKNQTTSSDFLPPLCFPDATISTPASLSRLLSASKPCQSHVPVPPAPCAFDRAIATT